MKPIAERQAQLRRFDNWLLENPRKGDLIALAAAVFVFAAAQFLEWILRTIVRVVLLAVVVLFLLVGCDEPKQHHGGCEPVRIGHQKGLRCA